MNECLLKMWIFLHPAIVSALEGKDCRDVMKSIAESSIIPQERLSHIIAGIHRVLSEAIRIPTTLLKQEVSCCQSVLGFIKSHRYLNC